MSKSKQPDCPWCPCCGHAVDDAVLTAFLATRVADAPDVAQLACENDAALRALLEKLAADAPDVEAIFLAHHPPHKSGDEAPLRDTL